MNFGGNTYNGDMIARSGELHQLQQIKRNDTSNGLDTTTDSESSPLFRSSDRDEISFSASSFLTGEQKNLTLGQSKDNQTASDSLISDDGHNSKQVISLPWTQSSGKDDPISCSNLCYESQPKLQRGRVMKCLEEEEMDCPPDILEQQDDYACDDDYFDTYKDHMSDDLTVSMDSVPIHEWIDSGSFDYNSPAVNYQANRLLASSGIQYPERDNRAVRLELFQNPLSTRNPRSIAGPDSQSPSMHDVYTGAETFQNQLPTRHARSIAGPDSQSPSMHDVYAGVEKFDSIYTRPRMSKYNSTSGTDSTRAGDVLYGTVYSSPNELSRVLNPSANRLHGNNLTAHSHLQLHQGSSAVEDLFKDNYTIPHAGLISNPIANNRGGSIPVSDSRFSSIQDVYGRADRDSSSNFRNPISTMPHHSTPLLSAVYSTPSQVIIFSNPTNRSVDSSEHPIKDSSYSVGTIDTIYESSGDRDNSVSFTNFSSSPFQTSPPLPRPPPSRKLRFSLFRRGWASQPKIPSRKSTADEAMESMDYSQLYPNASPLVVAGGRPALQATPVSMINQIRSKSSRGSGGKSTGGLGSQRSAKNKRVQMRPESLQLLEANLTSRASRYQVLSELEETMEPSKAKFQQIKMFFESIAARSASIEAPLDKSQLSSRQNNKKYKTRT